MRRVLLAVAGWLVAGAVAVVVGLLAVSLLDSGITGRRVQPLSQEAVASALARATAVPSAPSSPARAESPTPAPSPSVSGQVTRALDAPGGSVIARCRGTNAYLVSWTPRQGFESDDQVRGPARTVSAKFESEDLDVFVTVNCRGGAPVSHVATERDD
ncbi:MAG: hypothetical protein ACRDN9_06785 [Streptosporangiaceae bacterium]